ncbi:MAG: nucleotidyltransferase domain-containing protein [Ruminococcus flavefaciens]|nr:nucleotidyltransferase domain-containing protein [Ruminococcus flavefaciens]
MHANLYRAFKEREQAVLQMIMDAGFPFEAIGIFGSWARGESKGTSDIDFFVIGERPSRDVTSGLRADADDMGADIVFVTSEYFANDASLFARDLRRDAVF